MQKIKNKLKELFKIFGPSLVTGVADDDPSGIATYTQAGAAFGNNLLWSAIFTYPLVVAVQSMCARIGLVTNKGLTTVIKENYSKLALYVILLISFVSITANIGADIQAMGAIGHLLIPTVKSSYFSVIFTTLIFYSMVIWSYNQLSSVLKWLCISLFAYILIPFIVSTDWLKVLYDSIHPTISLTKDYVLMFVGILGTTISPYLFFWQTSMEVEERNKNKIKKLTKKRVGNVELDVKGGMFFTNIGFYFIILTASTVLHISGITNVETVEQAAAALKPIAGDYAYILFSLGILGTGFLAVPVLAGSVSYMLAETFNWKEGLDKKWDEAPGFYATIAASMFIGLCMEKFGINPIQALIYTAVLYGVTAPVLIGFLLHITNNKKIMGNYTNNLGMNVFGSLAFIIMSLSSIILIYFYLC